jgi:gliding motility-associated-like protein
MSTYGDSYSWNFAGLGTSDVANPSFVFPAENEGTYNVCLTVTTNQGCADSICHVVEIMEEFLVYVPNAFTPDGDGINDLFLPVFSDYSRVVEYEFLIFNRWGENIFISNVPGETWDAQHKNIIVKEDVFVWKLKFKNSETGEIYSKVGHVSVLR